MLESKFVCIAKTLQGLENVLAQEIKEKLGIKAEILKRAVRFTANLEILYRANFELRTALSIIIPILEFEADNVNSLYKNAHKFEWEKLISSTNTLAVNATTYSVYFNHSQYAALKLKDAIVDKIRSKTGRRPNVDTMRPDFDLNLHIRNKKVTISLNSSGEALNRRKYRMKQGVAPLNEVLAAGMLLLAGYNGKQAFYDFMCGSGTLLIEAGLIATETPPGAFRKNYGFFYWKNFDKKLWENIKNEAMAKRHKPFNIISGADISPMVISEAHTNVYAAELSNFITLEKRKFENSTPPETPGIIMMNLPYDKRIELTKAAEFYKNVSDILKQKFKNNEAWILAPKSKSFKSFALKPNKKYNLLNASIECSFNNYKLF